MDLLRIRDRFELRWIGGHEEFYLRLRGAAARR
jgi:hypothetical protein